ncbi:hypothetical protein CH373_05185 [Leptospira perolatii]|uniref:DUF2784 domain-containing protein n=2 Tax=Leptospira perolatii TaxID=2023191 RepID=A0A2M9ZQU7_9LEPT|nr:hypothetical protein CH360_05605 [Leptospira perolatii]PJZ74303.1 hypothetical protein CH373_05185 [Leptospira perolatii]
MFTILANLILILHLCFVLFVIFGAILSFRFKWMPWIHIPAAIWGFLVEMTGWICPLTPLEWKFRMLAGQSGYSGGFLEYYIISILYPEGLTREISYFLGAGVLLWNLLIYYLVWKKKQS